MVKRAARLLGIVLAAGVAPLASSACELLAGVHDVTLAGVTGTETGGPSDAAPETMAADAGDAEGTGDAAAPACGADAGPVYYVDPLHGADEMAGGSPSAPGSFQTITAAVRYAREHPAACTIVMVLDTAPVASSLETFPLVVPPDVTVRGQPTAVVSVSSGTAAVFSLGAPRSGLDHLTIDGSRLVDGGRVAGDVETGVEVGWGSDATTRLTDVRVEYMYGQGIFVSPGGEVTLGSGIFSGYHGPPRVPTPTCQQPPGNGLVVYGIATIHVDAGEAHAELFGNANYGIWVQGSGSLTMTGDADAVAVAASNYHGLVINQTPTSSPPPNTISRLVVTQSVGHGVEVFAGSSLKLRQSQIQASGGNGILVEKTSCGILSDDVANIDLGLAGDPGGNAFQFAAKMGRNAESGICLLLDVNAGKTLNAAGNVFEGTTCTSTPAPLTHTAGTCASGADYGVTPAGSTNKIDLGSCM